MPDQVDRLYELLPAIYRIRDEAAGQPVRDLLRVWGTGAGRPGRHCAPVRQWFIETCAEWVAPYIGDLLGVRPLNP